MNSGIYLITNNVNNKVYVGQTINFKARWHKSYNPHLESAFRKYGKENFYFHILEEVEIDKELLNLREQWWMDFFESYDRDKGYNICPKADSSLGYKHNTKSLEKMRGRILTEEQKLHLSRVKKLNPVKPWLGKHRDQETKDKISKTRKEKFANGELISYFKDKKLPKEVCMKISEKRKEYYKTHDNHMKGKNHSLESKQKMSNSKKGKYVGLNNKNFKFTLEQVIEIQNILIKNSHPSYKEISNLYKTSVSSINRIVHNMKINGMRIGKKCYKRNK